MKPDLRVYVLIDPEHCRGRNLAEIARQAVAGGATLFQYRDKHNTTRRQVENVRAIIKAAANVPVLVNDRVDVAQAADAKGAHLGRDDMDVDDARAILGPDATIGGTVHFPIEADAIDPTMVDYVGLGPVFATSSKSANDPALGILGLGQLLKYWQAHAPDIPACAISGINAGNAADVLSTGIHGLAVISAIGMAEDVEAATRELRLVVDAAIKQREAK